MSAERSELLGELSGQLGLGPAVGDQLEASQLGVPSRPPLQERIGLRRRSAPSLQGRARSWSAS